MFFDLIFKQKGEILFEKTTEFNEIKVVREKDRTKLLLDDSGNIHSLMIDGRVTTGSYWDLCSTLPIIFGPVCDVVILGIGGGSISRIIKVLDEKIRIIGVDIDKNVIYVAKEFFAPSCDLYIVSDFKSFIDSSKKIFDCIIFDVFENALSPPDIFKTNFWEKTSTKVRKFFIANLISLSQAETLKQISLKFFNFSKIIKSRESSNYILFCSKAEPMIKNNRIKAFEELVKAKLKEKKISEEDLINLISLANCIYTNSLSE